MGAYPVLSFSPRTIRPSAVEANISNFWQHKFAQTEVADTEDVAVGSVSLGLSSVCCSAGRMRLCSSRDRAGRGKTASAFFARAAVHRRTTPALRRCSSPAFSRFALISIPVAERIYGNFLSDAHLSITLLDSDPKSTFHTETRIRQLFARGHQRHGDVTGCLPFDSKARIRKRVASTYKKPDLGFQVSSS
jgi:hypothetical protein